jgi:maleate isomerase
MADSVEEASKLLADAQVEVIAFNCTVGSLIKDKGYDQEIIERINRATGVPATTTTTAIVAGLKALDIKKLILVSPYTELLRQKEKAFLESNGFLVLNDRSLSLSDCFQQYEMEPLRWLEMVIAMQQPQCEGYFISCGGIRVVDVIQQLENELKKPVITSNQSLIWHCLRIMGLQEQIEGFGRLLKTPLIC